MKIFISADIEGCTGIASFSQCGAANHAHHDYPFARRRMSEDLNAVIRGARRAGATGFVIKDGHGNCKNLLIDELEPGVELISGQGPTLDGMMDGIDSSFDGAMLVGYHAMAGAIEAFMEHALVGGLHRFWINERLAGEILTNAAVAGAYGVPTVLVSSDDAGVAEATEVLPGVETVSTKHGFGKYMGRLVPTDATTPNLEAAAYRAVSRLGSIAPIRIEGETRMAADFRTSEEAELAALAPGVVRRSATTISWRANHYLSAHRLALDVFRLSMQGRRSDQ